VLPFRGRQASLPVTSQQLALEAKVIGGAQRSMGQRY
jgi:hypothetical protein